MTDLVILFVNNLVPILLAASTGYLLAGWVPIDPRTVSNITFYIFSPFLIFNVLIHNQLTNSDLSQMMLVAAICVIGMVLISWLVGRAMKLERKLLSAFILTSSFMNAGNYGLPLTLFAFGEKALAYGSLFFVTNAILTYTLGVVIASVGSTSLPKALSNLVRLPAVYGLILGVVFVSTGWQLPLPLERTSNLLSQAAIPCMMVLLGMQLRSARLAGRYLPMGVASVLRLVVSPALAIGLALLFGLSGPARNAAVTEAAMPAAVLTTILATQYDTEPSFVTAVVTGTTLLSVITLPPILKFLGA